MSQSSVPVVRLLEHLATAPRMLHYSITSPCDNAVDDVDYENKWVFQAHFVDTDGITLRHVLYAADDFMSALNGFADAVSAFLGEDDE